MSYHVKRLLAALVLLVVVPLSLIESAEPAQAGVWGPVELINPTCSSVTVRFYYDGLESRYLYIPQLKRDRFRLQVRNRTCAGGGNCDYPLAEAWMDVPIRYGTITMTATWPNQRNGNGIEVIIGQYNVNTTPPTIVDRDYVGMQLSAFYTCAGGTAPPSTPTAGLTFQCTGNGVAVLSGGVVVLNASFSQIAGPLLFATATGQNQPILVGNGVSLWALKSNELQAHFDSNPDATKRVVSSSVCGPITLPPSSYPPVVPAAPIYTPPATGARIHIVQPGENLFRISLRYGRSMAAIAAANGITNYSLIYAGQRLIIP